MKKEVLLCEDCYTEGEEKVVEETCLICNKSICEIHFGTIEIDIKKYLGYNSCVKRICKLNILPICHSCLEKSDYIKIGHYKELVNNLASRIIKEMECAPDKMYGGKK